MHLTYPMLATCVLRGTQCICKQALTTWRPSSYLTAMPRVYVNLHNTRHISLHNIASHFLCRRNGKESFSCHPVPGPDAKPVYALTLSSMNMDSHPRVRCTPVLHFQSHSTLHQYCSNRSVHSDSKYVNSNEAKADAEKKSKYEEILEIVSITSLI